MALAAGSGFGLTSATVRPASMDVRIDGGVGAEVGLMATGRSCAHPPPPLVSCALVGVIHVRRSLPLGVARSTGTAVFQDAGLESSGDRIDRTEPPMNNGGCNDRSQKEPKSILTTQRGRLSATKGKRTRGCVVSPRKNVRTAFVQQQQLQ